MYKRQRVLTEVKAEQTAYMLWLLLQPQSVCGLAQIKCSVKLSTHSTTLANYLSQLITTVAYVMAPPPATVSLLPGSD
jgi:hypothetical protein